jgi:ubiquilin
MTDIQIKIKTTYKPDVNVVTVKSDAKVEDIMKEIEKYSQIPVASQKLIFKGKILKPEEPIATYKIENDSTLIMVKTVTQANTNNTSSASAPSNNVSSNPEENITIKVKTNLDATVHEVPINKNATVLGLKGEIEKKTHIPPAQQKLVIKGKTMKDSDPISAYELNNESTIAMIKVNAQNQGAGGLGGMPGLGGLEGNPAQMMNDPRYQQIMNAVLNNPQMLNQLLNSPELRPIFEQNPQLRALLQNPQARQLLLNPQLLERLGREGGSGGLGGLGGNPFAGLGGLGSIQPNNSPNTRLGELFTQWMDRERNQIGQAQPPRQPQPGAGIGGAQINPQPVFQQFPQPDPNVDYKEKYKEQIAQIKDMGIDDEEKIIEALKKCDGNVQYALNRLFG